MEEAPRPWRVDGHPIEIDYTDPAVESMRQAAMAGLQKVPKRGLEIGGVLLGRIDGNTVRVEQWREIECSHAEGPGFELSETDEQRLREMLDQATADPDISRFQVVGWFRTRTRGGVFLSEGDIDLYNRFFPGEKQIVFVVRPHMYEPAQAGFFFREPGGKVHGERSYAEFELENRRRLPLGFDAARVPRRSSVSPAPVSDRQSPPAGESPPGSRPQLGFDPSQMLGAPGSPPPTPRRPGSFGGDGRKVTLVEVGQPQGWTRNRVLLAAATVTILVVAVFLGVPAIEGVRDASVGLRASDVGGELVIQWNRSADVLAEANAAFMRIIDGAEELRVDLSPEELKSGTLVYQHRTGDVELHLVTLSGTRETSAEITTFVGASPPQTAQTRADASVDFFREEIEEINQQLEAERSRTERLRRQIEAEKRRLGSVR